MDNFFDNIIHTYTQDEAIDDGILVKVGEITESGGKRIVFTSNLMASGDYEDLCDLNFLIHQGLELLREPNPEDTDYMKLRVIENGKIWVIADANGLTFMRPEDY